jgi:two-component system, chemotaxis family, sensor kinase CheA
MILQESKELSQAFAEEVNDLLTEIENSLMQINNGHDNPEVIAKVFRSLHTIKGSSGMFGYTKISSFVHDLETTFDNIRQGKLKLNRGIIDLTLKSQDCIHNLLIQNDNEVEKNKRESILRELKEITASGSGKEKEEGALISDNSPESGTDLSAIPSGMPENYRIMFRPSAGIFLRGIKLRPLFKELASLGTLSLTAKLLDFPDLNDIDPENCYMEWEATLVTNKGIGAVKNVFIFVNDYARIEILKDDVIGLINTKESAQGSPVVLERRKSDSKSIRVKNEKLDQLVNLVGEMVTLNARFSQEAGLSRIPEFMSISESFNRLISDLRDNTMSIRMVPLAEIFNSYNRLVFELANKLNKKIELKLQGGETELDKNMIEELRDPMMHLIRNSADHGIELPADRIKAGKPETGTISLNAEYSGSNVLIKISDDGAGLNKEKIMAKALESGLADTSVNDENIIFSKIFEPGFSTADKATDISGRGVGLDVVKRNIEKLRGSISIKSRQHEGIFIQLTIPLTLAIIDGFMFEIGGNLFIFNLSNVIECLDYDKSAEEIGTGEFTISLRGEMISCLDLKKVLGIKGNKYVLPQVVIADVGGERVGFLVDRLIGKHQTVIKPISKSVNKKDIIVGATILGNGSIAFVLDVNRIIAFALESEGNNIYKNNLIH